jgi:hypothetical protein
VSVGKREIMLHILFSELKHMKVVKIRYAYIAYYIHVPRYLVP